MASNKQIVWWGRFDPAYSRNSVLRQHLAALGWTVSDFHPRFCAFGDIEALVRRLPVPTVVWVPCFRQRDMAAARRWCDRKGVPLVFDPLISAYDKQVWERFKLKENSPAAQKLLAWERSLCAKADRVIVDTPCHARFFSEILGVPQEQMHVVYVGADEHMFRPVPDRVPGAPVDVLFYGSFIPLHGTRTIVEAAKIYKGPPVRWSLMGDGPAKPDCQKAAKGAAHVFFENGIPYAELPARIHRADILLGVFGTTMKAGRVMPNKVFQALASGRPVITRTSEAYPETAQRSEAIAFVPPGEPEALAAAVASWVTQSETLTRRGHVARDIYKSCFSYEHIRGQLDQCLTSV